jgi:3-methylcrotonyl-CoA carboxylase alpha subunit
MAYSVEGIGRGWYVVTDGARRWRVAVAGSGDNRWVFAAGDVTSVRVAAAETRRAKPRSDGGVMAPMPATVVTVNVTVGQSVKHGDILVLLEAMKMELPIRAPHDGVITAVHCAKGELVQPGINLLEFQ